MEISHSNDGKISAFLPKIVRREGGGTHRGFICEATSLYSARLKLFDMALMKKSDSSVLKQVIFNTGL